MTNKSISFDGMKLLCNISNEISEVENDIFWITMFLSICNYMKISPRIYRKRYLTPLRKYLKIVERNMCAKKWDKIDYDLIPSKARLNLHYAFIRNDNKRYLSHKFNRKQNITPKYAHQIIHNYAYAIKINPIIEDTDFVLLLCVNPGFSNQDFVVSPIERTTTFLNSFPDYKGYISVDGAVKNEHIKELENLGVKVAIQGSAIFDR